MRLVTYDTGSGPRCGVLRDGGIVDIANGTLGTLLRAGGAAEDPGGAPTVSLEEARLLPPVPDPDKIVCIGLNYRTHAEEAGLDLPEHPTFFPKYRNALAAPGSEVALPAFSDRVDYEAEVAFVIGRRCKDVPEEEALDAIAGYTLVNDLTARDYQFLTPQWGPGKVFDGSAPCGPALVTPDEAGPHDQIGISLTLNREEMQRDTTASLVHPIPTLIAFLSKLMTLEAGDLVSTGTPAGVGSTRDPHVWLKPGDECVVESPTLGRLETRLT
ncbi:MAG: fumarylacetoacetate hydrolase family protein [Actinomycetota bacterium]|nr:fumarylacetoacetate hydrolase family protein [Actinomycetota bacterium]